MVLKAIDTRYKGYRFRSRLEARWAVFFDETFLTRWEYEVEGFDLGGGVGWYLPDFWLPDAQAFIEIKAGDPSRDERRKAAWLADKSEKPVYVVCGSPWPGEYTIRMFKRINWRETLGIETFDMIANDADCTIEEEEAVEVQSPDGKPQFADCCDCGRLCWLVDEPWTLRFDHIGTPPSHCRARPEYPPRADLHVTYAFQKARAARFEHGDGAANAVQRHDS